MPRRQVTQVLPVNLASEDVCTLVSIVPFMISEYKPGIYPGRFVLSPCLDPKKPETLLVGTSVYFIPQFNGDEELPAHVVKTTCKEIANAVVNDYMQGQMGVNEYCHPGFTFVNGLITGENFVIVYPDKWKSLIDNQTNWYRQLVKQADNDWNRYKNHKVVSDNQRFAAKALGLEKDWMYNDNAVPPVKCPACLNNCAPEAIVCSNCRCILDAERYKELTFAA